MTERHIMTDTEICMENMKLLKVSLNRMEQSARDAIDAGRFETAGEMCLKCADISTRIYQTNKEWLRTT